MTSDVDVDRICLSYWFPRIQAAGLPVPETIIVTTEADLYLLFDGESPEGWGEFLTALRAAADEIGYPVFLRTGHTSGKHSWRKTCYVTGPDDMAQHAFNLVEQSAIVDILGLPTNVWAVRKLLNTAPAFHAFTGMPIVREFRLFMRDGVGEHWQPYWPPDAFEKTLQQPSEPDWRERLATMSMIEPEELEQLTILAKAANAAVPGFWSIDFLQDAEGGWWLTDMALSERSFRWQP